MDIFIIIQWPGLRKESSIVWETYISDDVASGPGGDSTGIYVPP